MNGMNASLVLGQADFETAGQFPTSSGMNNPWDVAIDPTSGKVFVADTNHNRILRFASFSSLQTGGDAEAVLGQVNFTTTSSGLSDLKMWAPRGLVVDSSGILWVADFRNHRVLRFDEASEKTTGAAADGVLGKADFTSSDAELSQTAIGFPYAVAVDAGGNLFVGSSANNRVLMFADAANLMPGAAASRVFGQIDFISNTAAATRDGMNTPIGLAVDGFGNLFVADSGNHRVLRFDAASTRPNGADADAVLGQPDFITSASATGASGMHAPRAVRVTSDGLLWVADTSNHRLLGFPDARSLADGSAASFRLGQPDFDINAAGLSQGGVNTPRGIALDSADRLYVADTNNNRVLVIEKGKFQPDATIGAKSSGQRGANSYNVSGIGQTESAKTEGKEVKLIPKLENDGNVSDSYRIRSRGSSSQFRIKLFLQSGGRSNISSSTKTGSFISPELAPQTSLLLEQRIKPKGSFRQKRATIKAWIDASSVADGETDRVVGKIKNRP